LTWLDPEPGPQDLVLLYRNYYTHGGTPTRASAARHVFRVCGAILLKLTRVIEERKRLLRLFADELPRGSLLEVGCGGGDRLRSFADLGWKVTGQEVDPVAAAQASKRSGVDVFVGTLEGLAARGDRFDAIVMNHVIEHVLDPVSLLATCRSVLRSGGVLVCVTPNIGSWGHRLYGADWMPLDPPRHIVLFTSAALREAARRAGFAEPEVVTSCANAQASAAGSLEIRATGRYRMDGQPSWRSEILSLLAQLRAVIAFRADPDSGDELILRCKV
jgi:SAM-dependent methyltransferase